MVSGATSKIKQKTAEVYAVLDNHINMGIILHSEPTVKNLSQTVATLKHW